MHITIINKLARSVTLIIYLFCGLFSQISLAESSYDHYKGNSINPVSFQKVLDALLIIPTIKGEFESTDSFNDRKQKVLAKIPDMFIVSIPFSSKEALYDADLKVFKITSYGVRDASIDYSDIFGYGKKYYNEFGGNQDHFAVVNVYEKFVGAYRAKTLFNSSIMVDRLNRTYNTIYSPGNSGFDKRLFPENNNEQKTENNIIAIIAAEQNKARLLKSQLRAAVLIIPKYPYAVKERSHSEPTIVGPSDLNEYYNVIIADIKCFFITDAFGVVLAVCPLIGERDLKNMPQMESTKKLINELINQIH